jgi:DNA-binding XRE family transcriptional regulator
MNTPLKRLLFEREMTNRELARKCDLDENGLGQIINGKRVPNLITAMKIARALEVNVEDLWGHLLEEKENRPE